MSKCLDATPSARYLRHNPSLRPLYLSLLARGKVKTLALTALMRKLIVLANHLLK